MLQEPRVLQVDVEGLKRGCAPGAIPPWERGWQELGEPCPAWALGTDMKSCSSSLGPLSQAQFPLAEIYF